MVGAYLKCGDLKEGFARVRCPDCYHEFLLAFSCRGRWFCPCCHAKNSATDLAGVHQEDPESPFQSLTWEVDPLLCTYCQAEMRIISFINERLVIRKILEHLNLWEIRQEQPRPPPSRAGPQLPVWKRRSLPEDPRQQELFDDGWPGFEEPYITYD